MPYTAIRSDVLAYRALETLCTGSPGDHVLGAALDAAAGVLAAHIFAMTDIAGATTEMLTSLVRRDFRYSRGRDSFALTPVLAAIDADAPLQEVAQAALAGLEQAHEDAPHQKQTVDQAEVELQQLLAVTGEGGLLGEVPFAARERGQASLDKLRKEAAGVNSPNFQPTEIDRATDA